MSAHESRHAPWVREAIRAGQDYHIRTKSPLAHNAINLAAFGCLVAILVVTGWASTLVSPALYIPVAAVVFGWCYFALFILVVHEASHTMFLISESKQTTLLLNRVFGTLVALIFSVHYKKHWEDGHHEHHVRPMEQDDPQRFVSTGKALFVSLFCILFVPGFLFLERTIFRKKKAGGKSSSTKGVLLGFIGIWATILTLSAWLVGWPLALALFLGIHVLSAWNKIKGALEHGGPIGDESDAFFRSRSTMFLGRQLLMPFNITMHFEHHLNMSVPWYELPHYHRDLQEIVPPSVWADVINHRPLRQLSGQMGGLSEPARESLRPENSQVALARA